MDIREIEDDRLNGLEQLANTDAEISEEYILALRVGLQWLVTMTRELKRQYQYQVSRNESFERVEQARSQGFLAGTEGEDTSSNPYNNQTCPHEYAAWIQGWEQEQYVNAASWPRERLHMK